MKYGLLYNETQSSTGRNSVDFGKHKLIQYGWDKEYWSNTFISAMVWEGKCGDTKQGHCKKPGKEQFKDLDISVP